MRNSQDQYGEQIREEIILLCVQWYVLYDLSYSQLQMVMQQRGFKIDSHTFNYLVTEYSILAKKRLREIKRRRKTGWRTAEIMFQLNGRKKYLYRAVDAQGNTIDFLISSSKNKEKAKRFFQQTISQTRGLKKELLYEKKTIKINEEKYNWFWGLVIIILLSIWGKLIFDQVEKWHKNRQENPQTNLSLVLFT